MRPSTMLATLATLFALVACVKPSKVVGVSCEGAADCVVAGATGTCQPTGFCSYPDPACAGGERYSPAAGDSLASTCLGGEIACGAVGQACCTGSVCGSDLECGGSMTCVCGADTQVCCAGSTCGSNLTCGEDARCACGAIDEPCCGGSTCDTGLTCTTGSCTATVLDVATGLGHVCVLRSDRSVWCWGNDWRPWTGLVTNHNTQYVGSGQPHRIQGLTDVAALGSAEFSMCARKLDGTVWCWGHNDSGQLGDGTQASRREAKQIVGLTNVTHIEGGRRHACAVGMYNGTQGVWCWGRNSRYNKDGVSAPDADLARLGNNDLLDQSAPVAVDLTAAASAGQTVRSLSTGSYHSCMVMSDNTVWCWGRGTSGQLGNGASLSTKVPVQVNLGGITIGPGVTIDQVSCTDGNTFGGGYSTCIRLSDGAAYCFGSGNAMGDGTTTLRNAPGAGVNFGGLAVGDKVIDLATGYGAHCARTQAGDVWCWGNGQAGMLGNGDSTEASQSSPVKALVLGNIIQIDMSHRTGCAVDMQGRLFCWGNNYRGQILGGPPRAFTPVEVPL